MERANGIRFPFFFRSHFYQTLISNAQNYGVEVTATHLLILLMRIESPD